MSALIKSQRMGEFTKQYLPWAHFIFMKIAEPRIRRLMLFVSYACMILPGFATIMTPPTAFENVVGPWLTVIFGGFILLGAVLATVAVLPGVWWLERAGIISLITSLLMFAVFITVLGGGPISLAISIAFSFLFALRFVDIKGAQLAPKEG